MGVATPLPAGRCFPSAGLFALRFHSRLSLSLPLPAPLPCGAPPCSEAEKTCWAFARPRTLALSRSCARLLAVVLGLGGKCHFIVPSDLYLRGASSCPAPSTNQALSNAMNYQLVARARALLYPLFFMWTNTPVGFCTPPVHQITSSRPNRPSFFGRGSDLWGGGATGHVVR